jgi:Bacterial transcriptional activator domain
LAGLTFQDIASDPSAQPEIVRLQELRLAAIETKADALLRLGRHYELAAELQALVAEHPLRERMCGQLMTALYRSGRQADALDVYRRTMAALSDDLGIDPGPDLQLLYQAILRQELEFAPPGHGPESRLPARTSTFIGRRIELARLAHLVKANRLITVIGPGGSGKTSLAVEVARSMGAPDDKTRWTGGAVFVDLAAVREPAHVPAAVAAAIGVGGGSSGAAGQGGRLDILTAAVEGLASIIARRHPGQAAELLAAARSVRESTEIRLTLIEGHDTTNAWRAVRAALPSTVEAEATRGTRLQLRDLEHFARAVAAATHDA